ncbi:hypothetical protein Vretimale_12682, partial [Volvox reticuliferus]
SPNGSLYMTVLLDDFTKFTAVAFMDTKEVVREKVIIMITQLEIMGPGRSAPTMVVSLSMRSCVHFSGRRGIRHGMTVGYTREKMRALLLDSKLPQDMWAEVAATANYLRNISPAEG